MNARTLSALIAIGVIAVASLYLQPLLVGGMITDRGFTEQQAGFIASADLAGLALASFFALAWLSRVSWRTMAWLGLALVLCANLATTRMSAYEAFATTRFLCGLGSGTLLAIAIVGIGHSTQADRHYGFLLVCQLLFGTLGLWAAPFLQARFGLDGLYVLMALLAALVAVLGVRAGRWAPLLVATVVQVACLYVLMGQTGDRSYLLAMCLLAFGWNVVIPYQQGLLAEVDHSGKALALVATATGVGLALGPGAAASVLSVEGYASVNILAGALAVLSMLLVVPALLHVGRKPAAL